MKKILIISANYYSEISSDLLSSAKEYLNNKYIIKDINVPGVFEIPVTISRNINNYDGFIALGCVIRGETPHFDYISKAVMNGIMKISIEYKKPIGNAILTCSNKAQALARKNKGKEAAIAVDYILSHDEI
jgi:6,7-dimethyl-8-ribityllumazine synthase